SSFLLPGSSVRDLAVVKRLDRPLPTIVLEYDLLKVAARVIADDGRPEPPRGLVRGQLTHFPLAWALIEYEVSNLSADPLTAKAAQNKELRHRPFISGEAGFLVHQHKAGQFLVDSNDEWEAVGLDPIMIQIGVTI